VERRLGYNHHEIGKALRMLPPQVRKLVEFADFLDGVDPVFVGLHEIEDTDDGRSYRNTAHVAYTFYQPLPRARRRTTVVLPERETLRTVVHELGHVLDEALDFDFYPSPVDWYAATNGSEAFACAFECWMLPELRKQREILLEDDPETVALFKWLAAR
jgi:hypothetical protein